MDIGNAPVGGRHQTCRLFAQPLHSCSIPSCRRETFEPVLDYVVVKLPRFAFEEQGALFAESAPRLFVMLYQLREKSSPWLLKQSAKTIDYTYSKVPSSVRGDSPPRRSVASSPWYS